jgi:hypothetical protein
MILYPRTPRLDARPERAPEELMSVEENREPENADGERRAEGATRLPFEALVEVGGALGPAFEAQAINISEEGMQLRTAYLPDVGQPLTCRFSLGNATVLASGEVVWRQEAGRSGEFGIRFTNLDAEGAAALERMCGVSPSCTPREPGSRVRLHIEGLGSPMRARVKGAKDSELTVGSELGFLQVGKHLELEDATTGGKRPARIHRVEVEIDAESHVPRLVVTLRYEDEHAPSKTAASGRSGEGTPEPSTLDDEGTDVEVDAPPAAAAASQGDDAEMECLQNGMKGAVARSASMVGPAVRKLFNQAKTTVALLAARAKGGDNVAIPLRRTTAPPPGGGLHASGRKVVRGSDASPERDPLPVIGASEPRTKMRRVMVAGAVACAIGLGIVAMKKPTPQAPLANLPPSETAPSGSIPPSMPAAVSPAQAQPGTNAIESLPMAGGGQTLPMPPATDAEGNGGDKHGHHKPQHVAPFSNGSVSHGNVLRLKMDGVIEKIEGASQPTGFTVVIPNRRSLEAAAPLASRDGRIGAIRVTNESNGAELAVTFKDGVPNYVVRARGDTLEIVLAAAGKMGEAADEAPREMVNRHSDAPIAKKHHPKHEKR